MKKKYITVWSEGFVIQSCSTGAKNFTNYVFCHPQFSGVIQNIENRCAILTLFVYVDYYQNNQFHIVKIEFIKFRFNGTTIFNILDNTTELWMTRYLIGDLFSSGGETLYNNSPDQTALCGQQNIISLISHDNLLTISKLAGFVSNKQKV